MVKKLTIDEFIVRAKAKHGDKYNYSNSVYINSKTKVKIKCGKHGEFEQTPENHVNRGQGCIKCGRIKTSKFHRFDKDKFIKKSRKIHDDKYDYSLVKYKNNLTKVEIKCNSCKSLFSKTPSNHWKGQGCKICDKKNKTIIIANKSKNNFIKQADKKHNNKYDYSKVIYKNSKKKVLIICTLHDEFLQEPTSHLRGSGCPKCANNYIYTINEWVKLAQKQHNNKYDYSKVSYTNSQAKILIICPIHLDFYQTPNDHLRGSGCPKCNGGTSFSLCDFIKKSRIVHKTEYDYSAVKYINSQTKIEIICTIHGTFFQQPNNHFNGQGCPKCGKTKISNTLLHNTQQFVTTAKIIHGDKYDYAKVEYKGSKNKVIIICKKHGKFIQEAGSHLNQKSGCPKCSKKGTSKIAQEWINLLLIKKPELRHFYHEKGEFNIPKTNYKADGYDEKTKTIYEFHGDFWHGNADVFNHKLMNDVCKKTFGQLYKRTMKKQKECENLGYTYKSIWENDWIKGKMALKRIQNNFRKKQMLKKFPYQCEKCNYKCKFKSEYDRHCNSVLHKTGKRGVKKNKVDRICQICKLYEASCNTNLKNHILINHKTAEDREKEYPNYCKICDYGSFSKKLFDKHSTTKKHKKKEDMVKKLKDVD